MNTGKSYNPVLLLKGMQFSMHLKAGLLIVYLLLNSFGSIADSEETIDIELSPIITFDEVPVEFDIDGFLKFETDVIISESNKVYINIEELFNNLGVKCVSEDDNNTLSGFIENEGNTYLIDIQAKQISIGQRTIRSFNGMVKEFGYIYIETSVLTEAFGMNIIFNYRQLSIKMEANFELPLVKQMRLEQMRENINKLQNKDIIPDTIVKRDYHLLKLGTFDWSVNSYQTTNEANNNIIRLGLGSEFLFGQLNLHVYLNNRYKWDSRSFYYNWRWVDNDAKLIKQAQFGKIHYQSISLINAPVVGGSINNSPNTVRKASGFYTISEYTMPNWTVELYINDILVDYTVADASGLYVFKVPNVYGYTTLSLKFYGPMGEEKIEERTIHVPFTIMPDNTFEYSISGGMLEDNNQSRFGRADFNYGISRHITLGGGIEYLSSVKSGPTIPFANFAVQPLNKLFLSLEYAHDVKMRGLMSYNFGQSALLEVDYTDYADGQTAIPFKPNEELKVKLSTPLRIKKASGFFKVKYNQRMYGDEYKYQYYQLDAALSGYYRNFNANLSGKVNWITDGDPYSTTALTVSYRWRNGLVLRPLAEYNISRNDMLRCRVEIEKRVGNANISASYERNFEFDADYLFVGFRFDLNFARVGGDAYYTNNKLVTTESAQGSLAFGGDNFVNSNNNSSVGKGGILIYPFLDINQNGIFDEGERIVFLSNVGVRGGKAIISEKDSIVRITDLNAFTNYFIEFSDDDLDDISWQFMYKTYQVLIDPNQFKRVDVPIVVMGESNGMVYIEGNKIKKGIGRITVQIYNEEGEKVAETMSESDGYMSYLGLKPGKYMACLDSVQLQKLDLSVQPLCRDFTIASSEYGDIAEGIDFVLYPINEFLTNDVKIPENQQDEIIAAEAIPVKPEIKSGNAPVGETIYRVQLLSLRNQANPDEVFADLKAIIPKLDITETKGNDGFYRYRCGEFKTMSEANMLMSRILNTGWPEAFIAVERSK